MASAIPSCCVQAFVPNCACHQTCYIKENKLISLDDLSECDQRIIKLRVHCDIKTICAHHFYIYHTSYEKRQTVCSDPFSKHKKKIKGQCKISLHFSDSLKCVFPSPLIPGKKLCSRCFNEAKHALECSKSSLSPDSDLENNPPCDDPEMPDEDWEAAGNISASDISLNKTFTPTKVIQALEAVSVINPVPNLTKFNKEQRLAVFDKVIHSVRQNILNESVDCSSLTLDDYSSLLEEVRNKITTSNDRKERYSFLTLAPQSWSNNQVANYFGVSIHTAKKSSQLKRESGILPKIKESNARGRILTEEDIKRIVDFYNSDEYSRQLPGMKNVKSVKLGNKRANIQKRLLLLNLKELYAEYKKQSAILGYKTFGFSLFASKRPANVVTVGSSGTHAVCVCVYHQNVKLMLSALHVNDERHCFMDKIVCSVYNKVIYSIIINLIKIKIIILKLFVRNA
jgi:hypothetical protein